MKIRLLLLAVLTLLVAGCGQTVIRETVVAVTATPSATPVAAATPVPTATSIPTATPRPAATPLPQAQPQTYSKSFSVASLPAGIMALASIQTGSAARFTIMLPAQETVTITELFTLHATLPGVMGGGSVNSMLDISCWLTLDGVHVGSNYTNSWNTIPINTEIGLTASAIAMTANPIADVVCNSNYPPFPGPNHTQITLTGTVSNGMLSMTVLPAT